MYTYFASTTPVTIPLQARDWHFLGNFIRNDNIAYDDLAIDLKNKFRIVNPPTGTTTVGVVDQYLGLFFRLLHECNQSFGKETGKSQRNRLRIALEGLALQEVTDFLVAFDAKNVADENNVQEVGRKYLRGKLG